MTHKRQNKDYPAIIRESESRLLEIEKKLSDPRHQRAIVLLRLLKTGVATSTYQAEKIMGVPRSTAFRIFNKYEKQGLQGVIPLEVLQNIGEAFVITRTDLEEARGLLALAQGWIFDGLMGRGEKK